MSDSNHPAGNGPHDKGGQQSPAVVALGSKMPVPAKKVPVLGAAPAHDAAAAPDESKQARSEIAQGLNFVGNAVLRGVCTVKGHVEGNLKQADGTKGAVIVTETGYVKGDIIADQISVMGRTEGLIDATGGSVSLHDSANVSGHVRYFRIQVNGSELNATLERAPGAAGAVSKPAEAAVSAPAPTVDPLPEVKFPPGYLDNAGTTGAPS
ncbi:polymer-forming cytoskeletal protein [Caenimonas koreensis]|uniref:Protein CcmA, bactofilin family n=1 Tax=Caenimonas koreensis DSM 17982 TaxID=1121255 RepID=A0A844B1P6_9BURK|nr:polymer-forming cytoskeletal protein [Caenimonas koreensis]MRD47192.1 hypothetical protein [Caenimonas koreensis DSM 17982]